MTLLQAWALYPGATVTTRRLVLTDRPVAPSFPVLAARQELECALLGEARRG